MGSIPSSPTKQFKFDFFKNFCYNIYIIKIKKELINMKTIISRLFDLVNRLDDEHRLTNSDWEEYSKIIYDYSQIAKEERAKEIQEKYGK